jgi:shikimate kinase
MAECITILGPSASGKSTIGPIIAAKLGYSFYDSDSLISQKCGADIDKIFSSKGTEYFQAMALETIETLFKETLETNKIIAVGASPIQKMKFRKLIRHYSTFTIGLKADPTILINRIANSAKDNKHAAHPLLLFQDDLSQIRMLFDFREPFSFIGNEILDAGSQNIVEVSNKIESLIMAHLNRNQN